MPDPQSWISVNVVDSSDGDMITLNDKLPAQTADLLEERLAFLYEQARQGQDGDRRHVVFVRARKNQSPLVIKGEIPAGGVEDIRKIFWDKQEPRNVPQAAPAV